MAWQHRCSECGRLLFEGEIGSAKLKTVCARCGTVNFFAVGKFFVDTATFADNISSTTSSARERHTASGGTKRRS
jgi:phage FluMu protein Com